MPRRRPKVAEEKARSENPLSRRSANTTTRPDTTPTPRPNQTVPARESETVAPIAAQNVTKRTRSKFTVDSGVISVLPPVYSVLQASPFSQRYPGRTAHRVLEGCRSVLLGRLPSPDWSRAPGANPFLPERRGRPAWQTEPSCARQREPAADHLHPCAWRTWPRPPFR